MVGTLLIIAAIAATGPMGVEKPAADQIRATELRELQAGKRIERAERFMQRAVEDLRQQKRIAEEAVSRLERSIDSIKPLESRRREYDLRRLSDWYNDYILWLDGRIASQEPDLAQAMEGNVVPPNRWESLYSELHQRYKLLAERLSERVKTFEEDRRRLEEILDRRNLLSDRLLELEERLQRIEERVTPPERDAELKERLLKDMRIVQNDLAGLPFVDEDLLRHYAVVIEEGDGELQRLDMKREEYYLLQKAVNYVFAASPDPGAASTTFREIIRYYESQRALIDRRIEDLYRRRSALSPGGTLRGQERSQELWSYYQEEISRLQDYLRYLSVLITDWRLEVEEMPLQR